MNKTVLIIDDDVDLQTSLGRGLRTAGFNVLTANSATEATEILNRITPDGMVLDRMMVGMDGLTFLKNLRSKGITIPTIMLTAMTGPENTIDGLAGGADDYLGKPFRLQELILRLNNIMRNAPSHQPEMPLGLIFTDNEFFVQTNGHPPRILMLSGEEKKLLLNLTHPVGNIVAAQPMVAKRLRNKLNVVLSGLDLVTIRSRGYKLVCVKQDC